MGNRDI